ncbi:flagellar hook-associated protein 2 [Alkalispirillum mobile]|uniref:Flagellar hook-associated protein 2 n=1 Tax=Alkalispirillum mobile TaxID=85925 RepID=A0A498BZP4_9GAMM|nr:flagellar filament capping protein FliD [Alkalispirillum mobile]RLK48229.1 flagellar hook-associated protein 2 [Alkalispirillum mobile]
MASISSLGVGSGMDIQDMVTQLVEAERQPAQQRIDRQEQRLESEISGLGKLQQAVSEFGGALGSVSSEGDFRSVEASSNNEQAVSVSADDDAPPGSYNVEVEQIAQAQRVATTEDAFAGVDDFSAGSTSLGAGSFALAFEDGSTETFELEEGADTLQDVRAIINQESQNVRASVVDDGEGPRLVLTSRETGEENSVTALEVDAEDGDEALLNNLAFSREDLDEDGQGAADELTEAQNARVLVDGLEIERPTNEINDAIDGVSLTVNEEDETAQVNVSEEQGAAEGAVREFVEAYNTLQGTLTELNAYDPEEDEAGPLNGDATLRSVQSRMRQLINEPIPNAEGPVQTLADLGMTTQRDGTLSVDDQQLSQALNENRLDVVRLFTDEEDGMTRRLEDAVDEFTGADSVIGNRTDSLQDRMGALEPQQERLDNRMERREESLIREFSAMDQMVAEMNQTGDYLANNLPGGGGGGALPM